MSSSDDEDDFLSADEDDFGSQNANAISTLNQNVAPDLRKVTSSPPLPSSSPPIGEDDKIDKGACKYQTRNEKVIQHTTFEARQENVVEKVAIKSDGSSKLESGAKKPQVVTIASETVVKKDGDHHDDDDDEEEALAERIRERNLKIARKFSAEIAKNIKVSAPIPVKGAAPIGFKTSDIEYPNIPEFETKSSLPPAPPPTPALSTSFNSEMEPSGSPSTGASHYGWRMPNKIQPQNRPKLADNSDAKSEQARLALDRLSEKLSQSDKNLFEKVAEDIKKVSIKADEPTTSTDGQQSGASASIPLISDLSSTLGGWNWGSASRLLASASQVTSQVGSVLDTVVNVSQHLQQSSQQAQSSASSSTASADSTSTKTDSTKTVPSDSSVPSKSKDAKVSMSATEAISNDALVGFTLNAMESLGKKAFNVMTERDESGSLQIKGLGRPWERLMNMKQPEQQSEQKPQSDYHEELSTDSFVDSTLDADNTKKKSNKNDDGDAKLLSRRRRVNYEDNDKLD